MADIPEIPGGWTTIVGGTPLLILAGWFLKYGKDWLVSWYEKRSIDRQQDHDHRKADRMDAIEEAYRTIKDVRLERDGCLKDLSKAKDALSACRAECERYKVTIEWRDQDVKERDQRIRELTENHEGGHAENPAGQ